MFENGMLTEEELMLIGDSSEEELFRIGNFLKKKVFNKKNLKKVGERYINSREDEEL